MRRQRSYIKTSRKLWTKCGVCRFSNSLTYENEYAQYNQLLSDFSVFKSSCISCPLYFEFVERLGATLWVKMESCVACSVMESRAVDCVVFTPAAHSELPVGRGGGCINQSRTLWSLPPMSSACFMSGENLRQRKSLIREQNNAICSIEADEHAKWSKSESKRCQNSMWCHLYVVSKLWHRWTCLWDRVRIMDRENRQGLPRGRGGWGGLVGSLELANGNYDDYHVQSG